MSVVLYNIRGSTGHCVGAVLLNRVRGGAIKPIQLSYHFSCLLGGVVWRVKCSNVKLVCAVGSRNGIEDTKLIVLDFDDY